MRIKTKIENLQAELKRAENGLAKRTPDEIREDLDQLTYLDSLWEQFRKIPIDPVTRKITEPFCPMRPDGESSEPERVFEEHTGEALILAWFESSFCVNVHEDFGYDGPWKATSDCTGCIHAPRDAYNLNGRCLACRRRYPSQDTWVHKADLFEPVPETARPPEIKAVPCPCGMVSLTVNAPFNINVMLKEDDIFNWMTNCIDSAALLRLSRYARKCAAQLDQAPDDDDFRSRA